MAFFIIFFFEDIFHRCATSDALVQIWVYECTTFRACSQIMKHGCANVFCTNCAAMIVAKRICAPVTQICVLVDPILCLQWYKKSYDYKCTVTHL